MVLGTDFERLQIIPGAKHGNIQVGCVDCSMQQGKVRRAAFLIMFWQFHVKHLRKSVDICKLNQIHKSE